MRWSWLLLLASAHARKTPDCPILGAAFPAPTGLTKDPVFLSATELLTSRLNAAIDNGTLPSTSLALQVFSGQENSSSFGFYLTDEAIASGTVGVNAVNEDTVFRIGSISKLWTMFLYMTAGGTKYFQEPVSKYVPELRIECNSTDAGCAMDHVQWNDVTIGELASHQAGILRDYGFTDLSAQASVLQNQGFPELTESDKPNCEVPSGCDRKKFFDGVLKAHPITTMSRTPIYSNSGYQILGYALEAILDAKFEDILEDRLIKPLNLTRSSFSAPNSSLAVIPQNETLSYFDFDMGEEASAGGFYSSAADMAAFGRSILSSSLIDPATTRRWLRPMTHTSSLQSSVGAPWEIYSFLTPRLVDLYSKVGDIGLYSSSIGLSPDHDAGFAVLIAGENSHQTTATVSEMVADVMLPALDLVARHQARERFGGTYELKTEHANSSIKITADDGPGLKVESWISNGVDMYETLMVLEKVEDRSAISIRLQPNGLQAPDRMGFSAVIYAMEAPPHSGPILGSCYSWLLLDSFIYSSIGLAEFEFGLDEHGKATSISPRALRMTLPKA